MRLRQIPAGSLSLMPTGRSRALDTLGFSMCVYVCACVIVWRLSHAHGPKQRRCPAAFRNSGLFSPPVRCPPAVCSSCSAPKGNKMQKSFCTDTNGDADYELANNTRGRGRLLTHVYYLRTYWFPHGGSENPLQPPTSQDVRLSIQPAM